MTVTAYASEDPYICMATFKIPGTGGRIEQRRTSVFLTAIVPQSTTQPIQNETFSSTDEKANDDMLSESIAVRFKIHFNFTGGRGYSVLLSNVLIVS